MRYIEHEHDLARLIRAAAQRLRVERPLGAHADRPACGAAAGIDGIHRRVVRSHVHLPCVVDASKPGSAGIRLREKVNAAWPRSRS